MSQPIPYLAFNGNCAEAMKFYEHALGGKLDILLKNSDTPFTAQTPKDQADKIMHARLALSGGGFLYAGDCPPHIPYQGIKGVSLALNFDTVARATEVFKALAQSGQVVMALQPAFWSKIWGMLEDKFGVSWSINGELLPDYANAK